MDERVRLLDTDLALWRMVCALRMRSVNDGGALYTGWFLGPRTVLTPDHCVFSCHFFGAWSAKIKVIPGLNGSAVRAFGRVTSLVLLGTAGPTKGTPRVPAR